MPDFTVKSDYDAMRVGETQYVHAYDLAGNEIPAALPEPPPKPEPTPMPDPKSLKTLMIAGSVIEVLLVIALVLSLTRPICVMR